MGTGTMRDDFEDAFKHHEDDDIVEEVTDTEDTPVEAANDESEQTEPSAAAQEADEKTAEQDTQASSDEAQDAPREDTKPVEKAPASWTPAAREHWAALPSDVQAMVSKREGQIMKALEDGKDNRKMGERFNQVIGQYGAVLAAEGVTDPIEGINGLMRSVSGLRMGTPAQKAAIVADMVKVYGIDINELDNILSSHISGQPQQSSQNQNAQFDQMLQERLAPYNEFMQNLQQQKQQFEQQQQQKMVSEIDEFAASHEFYNDVYMDMADLLDVAAKNGRQMTMEQAYNAACASHPEISQVQKNRLNTQTIAQKKQAASSIVGKQAGTPAPNVDNLRDAIMSAWEG